jgi:hypothetical protein
VTDSARDRDSGEEFNDRSGVTINDRVGVMGRDSERAEDAEDVGVVFPEGDACGAVVIEDKVASDDDARANDRPWASS